MNKSLKLYLSSSYNSIGKNMSVWVFKHSSLIVAQLIHLKTNSHSTTNGLNKFVSIISLNNKMPSTVILKIKILSPTSNQLREKKLNTEEKKKN